MSSGGRAYNTRPSNAVTRPGQIQIDADREGRRPCRPSAQVHQEREERASAHEAALAERDAGAKHLAELQAKQAKEREARTALASKPLTRKELAALKKAASSTPSSKTASQVQTKAAGAASGQTQDDRGEGPQDAAKPRTQRGRVSTKLTRAHIDAVHAAANADVDDTPLEFEVTQANVKEALQKAGMIVAESSRQRQSQKQKAAEVAAVG
ncbi:hypothetical protein K474DRAFT_274915 [Panus rudis PR-1116 ss-1]|nr:hypothetical protein K474DRAFT_274915 [Panus rudis PR-1116 ss-1]